MKTVKELSRTSGISVRTLHYYDEIGLLTPTTLTQAGYRLYDENAEARLQEILFFRELDFPLKEISDILKSPTYDRTAALLDHKNLLQLRRERLSTLIALTDHLLKGEKIMSFEAFDRTKETVYAEEVKKRWGNTPAYEEYEKKAASQDTEENAAIKLDAASIFLAFSQLVGSDPTSSQAQELARRWQNHITAFHYTCTKEILSGLADMYIGDVRFEAFLDSHKKGTAQFMHDAIKHYCQP